MSETLRDFREALKQAPAGADQSGLRAKAGLGGLALLLLVIAAEPQGQADRAANALKPFSAGLAQSAI